MRIEGTGRILPEPVRAGKGHREHIVSCLAAGHRRAKPTPQLLAATVDFDYARAARTPAMTVMLDGSWSRCWTTRASRSRRRARPSPVTGKGIRGPERQRSQHADEQKDRDDARPPRVEDAGRALQTAFCTKNRRSGSSGRQRPTLLSNHSAPMKPLNERPISL